jgi:Uncharacterized protein conserved in bacteria (DUF2188)
MLITAPPIHVAPDDAFDDWIVHEDDGRELGHYPTRESAELVGQAIARSRGGTLVIHLPDGRSQCKSFARGWLSRLLAG